MGIVVLKCILTRNAIMQYSSNFILFFKELVCTIHVEVNKVGLSRDSLLKNPKSSEIIQE